MLQIDYFACGKQAHHSVVCAQIDALWHGATPEARNAATVRRKDADWICWWGHQYAACPLLLRAAGLFHRGTPSLGCQVKLLATCRRRGWL
jgi:hypothetical protein